MMMKCQFDDDDDSSGDGDNYDDCRGGDGAAAAVDMVVFRGVDFRRK